MASRAGCGEDSGSVALWTMRGATLYVLGGACVAGKLAIAPSVAPRLLLVPVTAMPCCCGALAWADKGLSKLECIEDARGDLGAG